MTAYRSNNVNRLVQRLCREPALVERLKREPQAVWGEAGLSDAEGQALAEGSPEALARVGLHPILQVHWMLAMSPQMAELINMQAYTQRLKGG